MPVDFESAMLHSKSILQAAGGCAVMLRGGILGCILQEFLSVDDLLNGPSAEVMLHCAGFVIPSEVPGYSYWDDDLTKYEIAIIIGMYTMYRYLYFSLCFVLVNH